MIIFPFFIDMVKNRTSYKEHRFTIISKNDEMKNKQWSDDQGYCRSFVTGQTHSAQTLYRPINQIIDQEMPKKIHGNKNSRNGKTTLNTITPTSNDEKVFALRHRNDNLFLKYEKYVFCNQNLF